MVSERAYQIGLGAAVLVILAGAAFSFNLFGIGTPTGQISADAAGEKVKQAMTAQGGQVTVESVEEASDSLYKVILNSGGTLDTTYITQDGKHILQSPVNASQFIRQAKARTSFLNCLRNRNVTIYGHTQTQPTLLQLQVLGGTSNLQGIYQQVNNQTLPLLAQTLSQQAGQQISAQQVLQSLPITFVNGQPNLGVQQMSFFENQVGCTYPSSGQ